jgi:histone H3/H4
MGRTNQTDGNKSIAPPSPKEGKIKKSKSAKPAAAAVEPENPKKPHRFRPGTVALREIRRYQKSADLLLRKAGFQRIVNEELDAITTSQKPLDESEASYVGVPIRKRAKVLPLLQAAAERHLVNLLKNGNRVALHARRVTLYNRDVELVRTILAAKEASGEKPVLSA